MQLSRHPRWLRILGILALFQMAAPSVAAIADAWRLDGRVAYDHIESESSATCVAVHNHDCALCSIATGSNGIATAKAPAVYHCSRVTQVGGASMLPVRMATWEAPPTRAPPTVES